MTETLQMLRKRGQIDDFEVSFVDMRWGVRGMNYQTIFPFQSKSLYASFMKMKTLLTIKHGLLVP